MYRHRLLGVFDATTGAPLEGADISDVLTGLSARTSSTGTVSLAFLADGGSMVRVRKIAYEPLTLTVSIGVADTVPITLLLRHMVELPVVSVVDSAPRYRSAALQRFEERRRIGATGYFISDAQFRKAEDRTSLANMLRANIPGARVVALGTGEALLSSLRCGAGGPPDVYIDGVIASRPGMPYDLSELQLSTITGLEYYPTKSSAPVEFAATTTACGVLLIWSRQEMRGPQEKRNQ